MGRYQMRDVTSRICVGIVSAFCAIAGTGHAAVVYDNGAPNLVSGTAMGNFIQAEDFMLPADTLITDVHFWSVEAVNTFSGSIDYAFYTDNGGSPNLGAPAVEGFAAGTSLTRTATGNSLFNLYNEFSYNFNVTPFIAGAGVRYWLGLHNGPLTNDAVQFFFWESAAANATISGKEDILPPAGDGWINNEQEHAFELTGVAVTVPEPTTLTLLGLGLASLGFSRRCKPN